MAWQPKNLTREQLAERRAEGVRLLEAGEMKQVEIARHLGVTEAAVSKWKRQLAEEGPPSAAIAKSYRQTAEIGGGCQAGAYQEARRRSSGSWLSNGAGDPGLCEEGD
jgi:transposase-like protein